MSRSAAPPGRRWCAPLLCAVAVAGCSEQGGAGRNAAAPPADSTNEATHVVRLDDGHGDPGRFRIEDEAGVLHVLTGPAGIAYREADAVAEGDFRVRATFTQYGAPPGYREAYGLFVGGRELDEPGREYTYLLVRGTGEFLVKRRAGERTETVVDWTPHSVVQRVEAAGEEPENTLAVETVGGETRYLVNDAVVHRQPASDARPYGVAGIRANHRIEVRVRRWMVERIEGGGR